MTVHLPQTDLGAVIALLVLLAGITDDHHHLTKRIASIVTQRKGRHGDNQATKAARRAIHDKTAGQRHDQVFRG
jgi:hypothetical protein